MYTVFRPNETVNPEFLFALLKTESYRRVFEIRMSASIDRRGSLRWKDFSRIKIGLPTIDEQRRIAETLWLIDVEIRKLDRFQELSELQKRAVLTTLLSGETVVPS
jgi:type I restriction enzyme S subunit